MPNSGVMKRARAQCAAALACLAGTAALAAGPARAEIPCATAVSGVAASATVTGALSGAQALAGCATTTLTSTTASAPTEPPPTAAPTEQPPAADRTAAVPVQASTATVPAQKPATKQPSTAAKQRTGTRKGAAKPPTAAAKKRETAADRRAAARRRAAAKRTAAKPPTAKERAAARRKAATKLHRSSHPSRGSSRDGGAAARKRAAARRKAAAKRRAAAQATASQRATAEASAAPAPWWGGERPFAASSPWNAQLSGTAPLAVDSAATVAKLVAMVGRYGPWIPTTQYGLPVYRVGAGQPVVPVIQDTKNRALTPAFSAVPLPPDAQPSQGTDKSLVVWQPETDTMWEFWRLRKEADGQWHATWGGRIDHVSQSSGVLPNPYGTSASGMALIGGVLTPEEIVGGEIHHALAMGVPEVAPTFVAPATDTDGKTAGGIPLGTRFRLDPTLDVASLKLPRTVAIIATAAQRYGIYVRDTSGAVSLYAQDPVTLGGNPWPAIFENQSPSKLLARFPWNRLQVVKP